jgi:hypothetical protein
MRYIMPVLRLTSREASIFQVILGRLISFPQIELFFKVQV